jgi:hypothetical protein
MAFFFICWLSVRSLLYAALQADVIWTLARPALGSLEWIQFWGCLSIAHFVINFPRILRAADFKFLLPIDIGLFGLGLWHGPLSGLVLTPVLGAGIWLTRNWTGLEPDWLLLWLGTTSAAVLFWREGQA